MTPESELDRLFREAFKRMAPDNYNPVPDAPVPMDQETNDE